MRQSGQRVHGPYQHRNKWRLVVRGADGSQEFVSFSTEAAARAHKTKLLEEITGRTVRSGDFPSAPYESSLFAVLISGLGTPCKVLSRNEFEGDRRGTP